jgi:sterol desaturase/sphingolipid hydroxylase (fatty acid hydroxylase superfamily)
MEDVIKPQNQGTKRLFKNPILEKLTRTHISIPLAIFFVYAAALLYWSITHTSLTITTTVLMFFIGMVAWTLMEYIIHRYVFHMTAESEKRAKLQYTLHGVHHEFPKDKERLAMPPVVSITIATVLLFIFRLFLKDLVFSFLPGFLVGYASYLSIHYMIHSFQPPKNFLKILWVNHSIHHYKNGEHVYGVSSPLWDYVFGTMTKK